MLFASCLGLSAQTETMYERGATYLENTVPPSPEPASIVKYADVPFTHSTGMAEYDIPFYTLQGRELSIPISLHYASGGIKLDEIAGVAGLGWTLQAGGCITRTVMDMPDEYVPDVGLFHHEMPSGDLLTNLEEMVQSDASLNFLRDVIWNRIDVSLDRYSYSVCGLSGSFVIQDNGTVFQLSGDGVLIDYTRADDGSIDVFTITGPDGTVYTFSVKELASRDGRGLEFIGPMNGKLDEWTAPTAWHLTSMRSRSGLETAEFAYSEAASWNRSVRSRMESLFMTSENRYMNAQRDISTRRIESIYDSRVLIGITLNGTSVSFSYLQGTGNVNHNDALISQQNFPFRLTGMEVRVSGDEKPLCRMDVETVRDQYDGRIVLNSLELYREDTLDDRWNFTYKSVGRRVSVGSQDWYGYYNGENEFSEDGRAFLCPYEVNVSNGGSFNLTNGFPNPEYASYMSLISVDNDRAVTYFTYEGNSYDTSRNIYIGVRVKKITLPGDLLKPTRVRYFTYESPFACGPSEPSPDMYATVSMYTRRVDSIAFYDWTYVLHETPVTLGPSIRDSRIYYDKVTEDVTDRLFLHIEGDMPDTNTSRSVYLYSTDGTYPIITDCFTRFPDFSRDYYDGHYAPSGGISPLTGIRKYYNDSGATVPPVLTRKESYAYEGGAYRLVSSTDYEYDSPTRESVLVDYHAQQVFHHWYAYGGFMTLDHIYHFPIYARSHSGRHPVKEIRVGYHPSGNDTTVVNTTYVPRMSMSKPVRVSSVTVTAGNVQRQMSYGYADYGSPAEYLSNDLSSQHCLSVPIMRSLSYIDRSISRPVIGGDAVVPEGDLPAFPDTIIHVTFPQVPSAFKEEITQYDWFDVLGGQALLPSSHVEKTLGVESWREDVLTRDSRGVITSVKEKGQPETVILWGYNRQLPVAVIENATMAEIQTAFNDRPSVIDGLAASPVPTQPYLDKIASLRTMLPHAHVTIYTHIPGKGVESVIDPAGMKTTFEYDHAGRLTCIRDNDGNKVEEHDYSLMADADKRRHMRSRVYRSSDGQQFSEDVRWWDVYGRVLQDISIGASGSGADLVTAYGSDFMMHDDVKTWLPYPVQNTSGSFQAEAESAAAGYHSSDLAYSFKNYEMSSRDRVLSTALPGYAGEHETSFETYVQTFMGRPIYKAILEWKDGHVETAGWCSSDDFVVEKTTDADGRVIEVCKDHFGKTIHTSVGNSGNTHYVYDRYDRLRAVIGSGIGLTDTLNMWRYDYDSLGRMSSKGIPGSVREYYTYDDEDRVIAILRDGVIKEMEYDAMNRVTRVWQTRPGGQRIILEEHAYDVYPSGVTGANPKGKKTQSRIAVIAPNSYVTGYTRITWSYDEKGRPVVVNTRHTDGSEQIEELDYDFAGEVSSSTSTYAYGNRIDVLSVDYTYDQRGRLKIETATLTPSASAPQTAKVIHSYDDLGRPSGTSSLMQNCPRLTTSLSYTLQGWTDTVSVSLNDSPLFIQSLGYDSSDVLSGTVPQYSGLISKKNDKWINDGRLVYSRTEGYAYDAAGRLAKSGRQGSFREYTYDSRGNILSETLPGSAGSFDYEYDGNRLISLTASSAAQHDTVTFTHDALGRMTFDGMTGQSMTYNDLDLIGNIVRNDTTLVNYSYLSDGTKLSALNGSGAGLVYRGPFVYRKRSGINAGSSLTLESAAFGGGLMTPSGAMLYVTDYLGSVRAVVDGKTGDLYKASDYSAFGDESVVMVMPQGDTPPHPLATAVLPAGLTLRDGYTGKEDQDMDFSTGYTDFGARQYSPTLRRWMTPDPLSEKYYGTSPYAFCNNNPVNFVDPDGRSTYVKALEDGKYQIEGGNLEDGDLNIYVVTYDDNGDMVIGESIGRTTSITSFYNTDTDSEGNVIGWMKGSIINSMDKSGINFISTLMQKDPSLLGYMWNARNGMPYDFKTTNCFGEQIDGIDPYRGMPIVSDDNGVIYTSARDIGNMMAGYVAGQKGLAWHIARVGFDGYQSISESGLKWTPEGASTQNAQLLGWKAGFMVYYKQRLHIQQ